MGGYGFYIFSAYGFALLTLCGLAAHTLARHRRLTRLEKKGDMARNGATENRSSENRSNENRAGDLS